MDKPQNDLRDRTKRFALQIIRSLPTLPKTMEARIIGKQLLRSGTSVGANYREAFRGRSRAEFIAKCGDCLRELEETGYWLELLLDGEPCVEGPTLNCLSRNQRVDRDLCDNS